MTSGRGGWLTRRQAALAKVSGAFTLVLLALWIATFILDGWGLARFAPAGFEVRVTPRYLSLWTYRGFPSAEPLTWYRGRGASRRYEYDETRYAYAGEGASGVMTFFGEGGVYRGQTTYRRRRGVRDADAPGATSNSFVASWTLIVLPLWLPLALSAVFPLYCVLVPLRQARRRAVRRQLGLCESCGYDLRGGGGERCPECGTAIADGPGPTPHAARPA